MRQTKGRIESFDFFRAYGCLAIILLHVVSAWKDDPTNSSAFYHNVSTIRMIFNNAVVPVLVRIAVPIFFMMSGALFLDPNRDIKIKKHVKKLLVVLGIFGYMMALIELVVGNRDFEASYLWIAGLNLLQEQTWSHLWYLYAMIGLYLVTPILRAWIKKADEKEMRVMMGVAFLFLTIIPTINSLIGIELTQFGIVTPGGSLLCYLLGYYLYEECGKLRKMAIPIGIAGGVLTIVVSLLFQSWSRSMVEPYHVWIVIYSSALFILLLDDKRIKKMGRMCGSLSSISFTIYIVHPVFINALYKGFHLYPDSLPPVIGEMLFWLFISAGSIVAAWVLKKIPGLRRVL